MMKNIESRDRLGRNYRLCGEYMPCKGLLWRGGSIQKEIEAQHLGDKVALKADFAWETASTAYALKSAKKS